MNSDNAPSPKSPASLPKATIFWYALPQVAQGFALLPVINYVPGFYSDHLGMSLTMVGLMLVLSRLADVIIDPLIGQASDRTTLRFGRRKPFILGGMPIMLIAAWFVFVPPAEGVTPLYLFLGLFFLYLGFALVTIPYASWGAELSDNYDERSRIAAIKGALGTVGSLIVLSIPVVMQWLGDGDIARIMMVMVICFIIFQPLTFGPALARVPDRPGVKLEREPVPVWTKTKAILANGLLMRLLLSILLLIIGMAIGATLNMIIFKHVVGAADAFAPVVFIQNLVAIAFIPIWLRLARHLGKHRAMAIAIVSIGLLSALTWYVGRGDVVLLGAIVVGIGAGVGAVVFLIGAMIADIVDRDLLATGEERTGLYMAAAQMAAKLAGIIGVLLGTAIPGLAGFQPSDAVHDPRSVEVLRMVYAFVCPVLALPAAWVLWTYPLDRAGQEELRRRISEARGGSG